MFKIALPADRANPDMAAVAQAFGLEPHELETAIKIGAISRCMEVGHGDADNKPRQVFASAHLKVRVEVDAQGRVQSVGAYRG
jgi:hypothetical protein